jgi:hypothetical protein
MALPQNSFIDSPLTPDDLPRLLDEMNRASSPATEADVFNAAFAPGAGEMRGGGGSFDAELDAWLRAEDGMPIPRSAFRR